MTAGRFPSRWPGNSLIVVSAPAAVTVSSCGAVSVARAAVALAHRRTIAAEQAERRSGISLAMLMLPWAARNEGCAGVLLSKCAGALRTANKKARPTRWTGLICLARAGCRSAALVDLDVAAGRDAGIELARTADLLLGVFDHLAPLADPADGAGDGEQNR